MKDLGIQASQRIAQASDPLQSLADISQNFPNLASVLSRTEVSKEHRAELKRNKKALPAGEVSVLSSSLVRKKLQSHIMLSYDFVTILTTWLVRMLLLTSFDG